MKPAETLWTHLSRRRSRVRVPSLPSLEVPALRQLALSHQTAPIPSWPNPVAQTISSKCLQIGIFTERSRARPHGKVGSGGYAAREFGIGRTTASRPLRTRRGLSAALSLLVRGERLAVDNLQRVF